MVYFLDAMPTIGNKTKVPSDLHMMQHVYRSKIYESNIKSISNTDTALTLKQHSHDTCLEGVPCIRIKADPQFAQTHHYRKDCNTQKKDAICARSKASIVRDTRILRHLKTVIQKTKIALQDIFVD